jgi:NtrC-family two-component system sensor histidine kinase KinB
MQMQVRFLNSLRFKVGAGYIVLVVINIVVTAWAIFNFARLTNALNTILGENYPNVMAVEKMAHAIERHDAALSAVLNRDVVMGMEGFNKAKQEFSEYYRMARLKQIGPDADAIFDDIHSTYEGFLRGSDSLFQLVADRKNTEAKNFYNNDLRPFSQRLIDNCFWLIEENQREMLRVADQTKQTSDEAIIAVLLAALLAVGLSVVTMVQFTKRIIEPAERLTETVHQIGRGRLDLKTDIRTNDEFGTLSREFNKMTERLRKFEEMNVEKIVLEKQKSESIVESIADAIIVCDAGGTIQLINHSAEELFQIEEANVLDRSVDETIADERVRKLLRTPGDPSLLMQPYLQFMHNGRQVYLRPRVTEIPSPNSTRGGVVLVLQDVSQFKELDKLKSDFMAAVSHEFRTPLTSINMSVDLLRQQLLGPLTPSQVEMLNSSKEDCDRLTKLVRDLLQLSKLESGKIERREEYIDLRKIVEITLHPFQLQFREKGVALDVCVPSDLPNLVGDEQQFSWLISNLVNNALRYTGAGGSVEVRATAHDEHVLLQVIDTGRGIAQQDLGKIFDKFVQVKQSADSTPGSVGLGLAIAKEIVEMYGGTIWVESQVGKGSTFSIRLPVPHIEAV